MHTYTPRAFCPDCGHHMNARPVSDDRCSFCRCDRHHFFMSPTMPFRIDSGPVPGPEAARPAKGGGTPSPRPASGPGTFSPWIATALVLALATVFTGIVNGLEVWEWVLGLGGSIGCLVAWSTQRGDEQ